MTQSSRNELPIGIFDSGVGGLTVLRALKQHLPQESFLYLGDTARLPYGTKSPETIIRYAQQASQLLVNKGIKLLVIACNTVTALALNNLEQTFLTIPIIGVIEPGAAAAVAAAPSGNIAVIATEATVNAQGYHRAILRLNPQAQVRAQACSLLVALAEEGWSSGEIVEQVVRRYLKPLLFSNNDQAQVDCLILGCTHFPVLISAIKNVTGETIQLIDSAQTTANAVKKILAQQKLLNYSLKPNHSTYFVTDSPARFARFARFFLGETIEERRVELVDLTPAKE